LARRYFALIGFFVGQLLVSLLKHKDLNSVLTLTIS